MDDDHVAADAPGTTRRQERSAVADRVVAAAIRQLRRNDFQVLYLSEIRKLVGFVIKLGATVEEASDVAHSAFELAWRDWDLIVTNRTAWLRTVATRLFFKLTPREETLTGNPPDRPVLLSPDIHIEIADQTAKMLELLRKLPLRQALVIAWKADGFSTREIAESLGISPDAVRQNLHRGRQTLKQLLGNDEGGAA